MSRIPVFFCEALDEGTITDGFECPAGHYTRAVAVERGRWDERRQLDGRSMPCGGCGADAVLTSRGFSRYYRRHDTGEELGGPNKLPPGACWDVDHYHDIPHWCGPDGRALMVMLPDGMPWHIDGQANNCTLRDDKVHKCWVRHGRPEDGTLHADKNGHTCSSGAGSIATSRYHGFLHHGHLVGC